MTPCYYCEADGNARKTCIHSDTYIDPQEEITKLRNKLSEAEARIFELASKDEECDEAWFKIDHLREQVAAQAAVIEKLLTFVKYVAEQTPEKPDYWSSCGQCSSNSDEAEDLLAIPADNTQILEEVRKQEREWPMR